MAKKTVATLQTGKEGRSYLTKKFKTFSKNNSVIPTGKKFLSHNMKGTFFMHKRYHYRTL